MSNWIKAFDRVHDGEMPPKDYGEPDKQRIAEFTQTTAGWIKNHQQTEHALHGRVRARRLTNIQLERTLQDLFAIDVPLASLMSDEQRTDGFVNIADGQPMSHFQLQSHLTVVDAALDAAFDRAATTKKPYRQEFSAREIARKNPKRRCREPEMLKGKAVVWSGGPIFYGRLPAMSVEQAGWYRMTYRASGLNVPKDRGIWCSVKTGLCYSGAPLLTWVGSFELTNQPKTMTFDAWIPEDHMVEIRPADITLKRGRFAGGQVGAGEGTPQKLPGIATDWLKIERIFPAGSVRVVHDRLFGKEVPVKVNTRTSQIDVQYKDPTRDAVKQLRAFTRRAFRRDITEQQLQPYAKLLRTRLAAGDSPATALRSAYRSVLCSPRFMYFVENPGPLDDYAIASRLSYMLWGSMPDWVLMRLAKEGKLREPKTIREQADRMLKTRRGKMFISDFADQWLDLVDIDFTEPDRKLYSTFDQVVQNAMLRETQTYLQTMLSDNSPVVGLVKSKHTFLNSRLARYYGINGVKGDQLQRVSLTKASHRGGLLAQGSILKVTANGTNTSPVLRGVWVADKILGKHIPPPPENVPAIEPDIRGATTIREQLQKHRDNDACAVCHQKIDPNGFALENFDAAGRWRERYQTKSKKRRQPVDASYQLADGKKFDGFDQYRDLVASEPEILARNLAQKFLIYGTGAPIAFSDRDDLTKIVHSAKSDRYGFRSILHAAITSDVFCRNRNCTLTI